MADDTLPVVLSYDRWVALHEPKCNCTACYQFHVLDDRLLMNLAHGPDHLYDKAWKQSKESWMRNCPVESEKIASRPKAKHHSGNGAPKGTWSGTLTMSPTDPTNEAEMLTAIQKIMSQKTCPVLKYAWYLEYTENGTPHIHFIYQTPGGGRIHQKVFRRLWPIWDENTAVGRGHRGGYHKLCHDTEAYLTYIKKDGGIHASNW